jgi:hypothetical protein
MTGFSYPLAMPSSPSPVSINFSPRVAASFTESDFSLDDQIGDLGGERWELGVQYPPMLRVQAEEWAGFILKCRSVIGTFLWGPPVVYARRGTWNGTPLVKDASQTGNVLLIDGLANNDAAACLIGDWVQLGSTLSARLHKLVATSGTNASGEASLLLWPAIQTAPADNAAVTTVSPKGLFRLAGPHSWDVNKLLHGFTLNIKSIV